MRQRSVLLLSITPWDVHCVVTIPTVGACCNVPAALDIRLSTHLLVNLTNGILSLHASDFHSIDPVTAQRLALWRTLTFECVEPSLPPWLLIWAHTGLHSRYLGLPIAMP